MDRRVQENSVGRNESGLPYCLLRLNLCCTGTCSRPSKFPNQEGLITEAEYLQNLSAERAGFQVVLLGMSILRDS